MNAKQALDTIIDLLSGSRWADIPALDEYKPDTAGKYINRHMLLDALEKAYNEQFSAPEKEEA